MKPNLQQTELLKDYLRHVLNYRETYEEVYDHILTALEQKLFEISFEDAVNTIIKNDFGGGDGLLEMEKKYDKLISKEISWQQWNYFKSNFELPNLIYTTMLFLALFYCIKIIPFSPYVLIPLFSVVYLIPGIFIMIRYYNIGYFVRDTKKSIRDKIMGKIATGSYSLFNPGMIIFFIRFLKDNNMNLNYWVFKHNAIVTIISSVLILYVLAFIKLSRQELKVYMIK